MRTVLLVDDDPLLLELFSEVLEDSYSVLAASSVDEALRLIKSSDVDAVVSDLHIRHETPDLLFDWICSQRPELASRIILMTGDATFDPKGYDERLTILRKPVGIGVFEDEVSQLFNKQQGEER